MVGAVGSDGETEKVCFSAMSQELARESQGGQAAAGGKKRNRKDGLLLEARINSRTFLKRYDWSVIRIFNLEMKERNDDIMCSLSH